MKNYILAVILISSLAGCAHENLKFSGNMDYTRSSAESLTNSLELKYRLPIYETQNNNYMIYLGGKIFIDYDVFNNESRINSLSSLGLEF